MDFAATGWVTELVKVLIEIFDSHLNIGYAESKSEKQKKKKEFEELLHYLQLQDLSYGDIMKSNIFAVSSKCICRV